MVSAGVDAAPLVQLRQRTQSLHRAAERSGVIAALLRGTATRNQYALLLRNLLPAYRALEAGLLRHELTPGVGLLVELHIFRSAALEADLTSLAGGDWIDRLPLLPAGATYESSIAAAGEGTGALLIAHAYVRYLGDLNGGQILSRLLSRQLGLGGEALNFYDFPAIPDLEAFRGRYAAAIAEAAQEVGELEAILNEAEAAFRLNIAVSEAVRQKGL